MTPHYIISYFFKKSIAFFDILQNYFTKLPYCNMFFLVFRIFFLVDSIWFPFQLFHFTIVCEIPPIFDILFYALCRLLKYRGYGMIYIKVCFYTSMDRGALAISTSAFSGNVACGKGAGAEVKCLAARSYALLDRCRICIGLSRDVERYHDDLYEERLR